MKTTTRLLACVLAATAVGSVSAQVPVTTSSATFQQGTGGYAGGSDRVLTSGTGSSPATTSGSAVSAPSSAPIVMRTSTTTGESQYFVKFDSLFGASAGQVPSSATILGATLSLKTGTDSGSGSAANFTVSGLKTPFTSGSTLGTAFTGVTLSGTSTTTLNGPTYAGGQNTLPSGAVRAPSTANTAYSFPVLPVVQQWFSGTLANNGFAVQAHTSDNWIVWGDGAASAANRPQLTIQYTTAPTTTSSIKTGMTIVTMNGVTNATTDASSSATVAVDGATGGILPGDGGSPDLLALVKIDNIFGSAASQVPYRAQVLKSWFVVDTTNGSNDESNGSYGVYRMNTAWSSTTQYQTFGGTGPVSGSDYVAAASATIAAMPKNTQAWSDVSADVAAWQSGTANNGLLIRAIPSNTDGWTFAGTTNSDANRRPELRTIYAVDSLVWKATNSSAWDAGSAVNVGGTQNWATQTGGTATNFINTDRVVFDDTAAGSGAVSVVLAGSVAPQQVTFDNGVRPYTLSGSGGISGAGALVKTGTGRAILATDNSFTGGTTIQAGTLQIGSGGSTGALAGNVAVASGATLEFNRSGATSFAGTISGSGGVSMSGPGRVSLTSSPAFTGPVVVRGGTLAIASGTTLGGLTVADAATFLATSGLAPATFSTTTLALGTASSTVGFELAAASNPGVPLLAVTGADGLQLSGGSHTLSVATTGALGLGQFTLIDYNGTGIASGFTLAPLPQRLIGSLVYDTANTTIDLSITGVNVVRWKGGVSSAWDVGTAADQGGTFNWVLDTGGTTATNFATGDQIRFDDTATTGSVSLSSDVAPGAITIDNATVAYSFAGPGVIIGSGGFTKQGLGTATLLASNSSSGLTTVSAGTLQIGDAVTAPTIVGPVVLDGGLLDVRNGTLSGSTTVNTAATASFSGGVATGRVTVAGGTASFSGGGLAGGATVTSGRLAIGTGGTAGSVVGSITVADPATLAFNHTNDLTYAGVLSGSGAIVKAGPGRDVFTASSTSYTGTMTINGGAISIEDPTNTAGDINAVSIVVNSSGTFQFGNNTVGNPDLPNTTYITANEGGTVIWQEGEDFGGLIFNGGLLDVQQGSVNANGTTQTQLWSSGTLTGSGASAYAVNGSSPVIKSDVGTFVVNGLAWIGTSGVQIQEGTMRLAAAANLFSGTTAITLGGTATQGTLDYAGVSTSHSGTYTLAGSGGIAVTDPTATLTLTTGLRGVGSLVKSGSGTLRLSGSGSYTGGTTITGGTLTAGVPRALGVGNVVVGSGGVLAVATTLDLGAGFGVSTQPGGTVSVASGGSLPLAAGSSLEGFRSASAATTAAILSGSVAAGGGTVSMTWLPTQTGLYSDILELSTATGTSPFVLSMSYSSGLDAGTASSLALGWNSASGTAAPVWVNATTGNTVTTASPSQQGYLGSFTDFQAQYGSDLAVYVGAYGRDPATSGVWAVVNHNSQFVIVPEPGAPTLLAIAAVAAWAGRRLRRAAAAAALAIVLAVVAAAPASAQIVVTTSTTTFQQGTNGYSGATDRTLTTTNATSNGSTGTMDMNDGASGEAQYFLLFDSIFGSGAGQIPSGATILNASLTLKTGSGSNNQSGGNFTVAGLKTAFTGGSSLPTAFPGSSVSGSTTASLNGPTYANGGITLPVSAYRAPALSTAYSAFVGPLVQLWSSGSLANNGFALQPHTTDAWVVNGVGNATVANRPALSVAYTTAPTTTSSIKTGMTLLTLNGVTNVTTDASSASSITVDGATSGILPGDANSPDLLGLVKIDGIFGSGASQLPLRAQVLKAWFVVDTGNASSDESNGAWGMYRMNTAWTGSTQYQTFGSTGPVSGSDYVAAATATIGAVPKNTQAWFDITGDLAAWQSGTANNGLLIRAVGTNSDGWVFGGPTNSDAARRPELRTIYAADTLVWKGATSTTWDKGTGVNAGGTQNWQTVSGGNATNFIDTDTVTFDDTAAAAGDVSVVLAGAVSPRSVTFTGGSRRYTLSGPGGITGAGSLTKAGLGRTILATDNSFTGGTTIQAGVLQVGDGGSTGSLAGNVSVASGATLEFNRAGTSSFTGQISGGGGVTKNGSGRVSVTGSSSFTGPVVVNSGSLGMAPFAAAGGITVGNGASFIVINSGSEQTLSTPTLSLGSTASDLRFELTASANPTVPLLAVTEADGLRLNGGAQTLSIATAGALSPGRFTLIDYAGVGITSGFTLAALPSRLAGSLVYDTTNTTIDLDITGIDTLRWTGLTSGIWDVGTDAGVGGALNWELSSSAAATNFVAGDQVTFDDSAAGGGVILAADVAPGSLLIDNSAVAYTFSGAGAIGGGGGFTKQGVGTATLLVSNSSTGLTTVAAGTLRVGDAATAPTIAGRVAVDGGLLDVRNGTLSGTTTVNAAARASFAGGTIAGRLVVAGGTGSLSGASLGAGATVSSGLLSIGTGGTIGGVAGSISVGGPATLAFNHTNDLTYADVLSGSGAIVKEGTARDVFTASSTGYTGTMTINGGAISIEDPNNSAGDINAVSIVVNNSGTFQFGNNTIGNPDLPSTTFITANAGGRVIWQEGEDLGGVHLTGGEVDLQQGSITSSGVTPQVWTHGRLTGSGSQAFSIGGADPIVKTTAGIVTIDGRASLTTTGTVTVEDGSLRMMTAANLGTAPLVLGGAATAGTVMYEGASASLSAPVTLATGGGSIEVNDPAAVLTLAGAVQGSGPLAKSGAGTLLFAGANTMQGGFTVVGGTLSSTPYNAAAGGSVAAGAGFGVVNTAATTTLTLPTLALAAGSSLGFTLAEAGIPSLPLLSVTTPDGLTLSGSVRVSLASSQALGVGRFTLVEYDGAPLPASFTLASLPPRVLATLVNDAANTRLDLDVLGTGQIRWQGGASSSWDTGSAVDLGGTRNWIDTASSGTTNFIAGDRVRFDDAASPGSVVVDESVSPAEIVFGNAAVDYTFTGSGAIAAGTISKTAAGRVTFGVSKTGTQASTIAAGTLQVGDAATAVNFAGPVTVASGASFDVRNGTATGRLTLTGGVATVSGSLAGGATVTAGELRIGTGGTTGGVAGNVSVASGATMTVDHAGSLAYSGTLSGLGTLVKTGTGLFTLLASSTGFTGTVTVNAGELTLEDRGQGGDLNATSIVVNNGGRFTFAAAGNADFPQSTDVTINTGGVFDLQQGENWGGLILDGGTMLMSGTRTGVNANLDRMTLRSGRVEAAFTSGGAGGLLNRISASQFLQKTSSGTVTFGPGASIGSDVPVNLEDGVLDFDVTALPATGNGAFTIGDVGNATGLRMSGVGTGTFGRYAYVGNPSLTIDVVNAASTMVVTGTMEGTGTVTKTGLGTLDLRRATGLTAATTVAAGTLRVSDAASLAGSEVTVRTGATLAVATGVAMRSPKVTLNGGTFQAGTLVVDSSAGVHRVELHGAASIAGVPSLSVGSGGSLVLSTSASLIVPLTSLAVDEAAGLVDLGAGSLTIAAGGITQADLMADLAAGRGDGSWNGTAGLTSSLAAASGGSRTIGWLVDAGDGSTRVGFTAAGDTNLDGMVDIGDVANLLGGGLLDSGLPGTWDLGDFNYDGLVDQLDLGDFLGAGLYDAGSFLPASAAAAPMTAVPEPAVGGLALVAAAVIIARRRVWLPVRDVTGVRGSIS